MSTYIVPVVATTNATAGTDDEFIQLTAATGVQFGVRRFRIFYRGGTTAVGDNNVNAKLVILSAAGSGGVSATPVKLSTYSNAATTTASVKSGTTAFTVGTISTTFTEPAFNERGFYEWVAADESEYYWSGAAGIVALIINNSAASRQMDAEVEFVE